MFSMAQFKGALLRSGTEGDDGGRWIVQKAILA